jgi:hypothetical protein
MDKVVAYASSNSTFVWTMDFSQVVAVYSNFSTYTVRLQIKNYMSDANPLLEIVTGGGIGLGSATYTSLSQTVEFLAAQYLVAGLTGLKVFDVRVEVPGRGEYVCVEGLISFETGVTTSIAGQNVSASGNLPDTVYATQWDTIMDINPVGIGALNSVLAATVVQAGSAAASAASAASSASTAASISATTWGMWPTRSAFLASSPAAGVSTVQLLGFTNPGDCPPLTYVKVGSAPSHPGYGTTANSLIFAVSGATYIYPQQIGVVGAANDNGTIHNADLVAIALGVDLVISQVHNITTNLTIVSRVIFTEAGMLNISSGVTVAFSGGLIAPITKIFACTGTGTVTINTAVTSVGYPEWWGALTNNTGHDCSVEINACIVACTVTQLQLATYYVTNTVLHQTQYRTVMGVEGDSATGLLNASSIVMQNGVTTVYQIGPNSYTLGVTVPQSNNYLKFVSIGRSVAPVISSNCYSLLVQFTTWTLLEKIQVLDGMQNIVIQGTGQTRMNFVSSIRYLAGTGGGTDIFTGFNIDGNTNVGFAGGNASLYMSYCIASCVPAISTIGTSIAGIYGWSDLYIDHFETAGLNIGIYVLGSGNTSSTRDFLNEDLIINNCVLDTCLVAGIEFNSISTYGAITVSDCYIACSSAITAFQGCLYFSSSKGAITVTGCQFLTGVSSTGMAVQAVSSSGIMMQGNITNECPAAGGAYQLSSVNNCSFQDSIRKYSGSGGATPGVQIFGTSTQNFLKMDIEGAAGSYTDGYYINSTSVTRTEFNCTSVNSAACTSGHKINNQGTGITAFGVFGTTNLASGVMN